MKLKKYIVTIIDDGSRRSEESIRELECQWGADEIGTCEDAISREDAVEVIAGADETDGNEPVFSGKQVIKMLKGLPLVTPRNNTTELNRVLDRIITQIEQARDKDKLCEYPYNRCIRIVEAHRTRNSPTSVPAPKRKAAIERQVIVTWFTPEEKLPEEDIGVLATVTARVKNREFIRAILTVFYCKSEGWYELDYGFTELTVHAWCDLDPYEGG